MKINLLFLIFVSFFFTACSQKNIQIADLEKYSQNPSSYIKNFKKVDLHQDELAKKFVENYFLPWNNKTITYSKEESMWGNYYASKKIYLENHNLASKEWFVKQIENSNFEDFNKILQKAITIKNTNFRVFPTTNKMFYNPEKAGEGFPFDYNQNSRVKINTPVLISHYSKDKAWAFVESHYVLGWVRIDNLLFVDKKMEKEFKQDELYVITKEGFNIFEGNLMEDLKVGTFFPKKDNKYLLATDNGLKKVTIEDYKIKKLPLEFSSNNIELLSKEFIGELYGWGGLNNHRDCSSFTQDFFAPYGIYLKRNSKAQTKLHKYIDLSNLTATEKKTYIKENAIPFLTLIYLKGHIMLYIGINDNEPMVMHNMWGVRTWEFPFTHSRNIVGKTVITTLQPGIELNNVDKNKTILQKIQGIVFLNQKED